MAHPETREAFDPHVLLAALQAKKTTDAISWRELARRAGMPHSYGIAAKLRAGAHPSAGVLVLLLRYLGETDLQPYTGGAARQPTRTAAYGADSGTIRTIPPDTDQPPRAAP